MAFLDFIRDRNASQQRSVAETSQEKKPETAKQMYGREAQEKANLKPMDQMPPEQLAKVDKIKATLEKATQHIEPNAQAASATPADAAGNREAARQNMTGQDKTAPALSPTSAQAGKTTQEQSPAPSQETPKPLDKPRPQTVPRPRPSWER